MTPSPLSILLVDDEPTIRLSVGDALQAVGHRVSLASDGTQALGVLESHTFDLVITDIRLPKANGLEIFAHVREQSPQTDVILITAFGSVSDAVRALKQGAHDYLTKPFDLDELLVRVARIAEKRRLEAELTAARVALSSADSADGIIGNSPPMARLKERIRAIAGSDANVLILGESGTGKELVARCLHRISPRCEHPFVAVNCAAFPEQLLGLPCTLTGSRGTCVSSSTRSITPSCCRRGESSSWSTYRRSSRGHLTTQRRPVSTRRSPQR